MDRIAPKTGLWVILAGVLAGVVLLFATPTPALHRLGLYTTSLCSFFLLWYLTKNTPLQDKSWKYRKISAIAATFLLFSILFFIHRDIVFVWDSYQYFDTGTYIMENGLLAFPQELMYRGYLLPLILGIAQNAFVWLGFAPQSSYFLFAALVYAIAFGWLLPTVAGHIFKTEFSFLERLFPGLLTVLFFWGLLCYPLSDTWAFIFLMLSIFSMWQLCGQKSENPFWKNILWAFGSGISLYGLYNIRSMYILAWLPATALVIRWIFQKRQPRQIISVLCIAAGFLAVASPQMILNQRYYGKATPMLQTEQYAEEILGIGQQSLIVYQLTYGIEVQRYETYIGPLEDFPNVSVPFPDPAGQKLLQDENKPIETIGQYLLTVAKHPFTFFGIYARHFLNALDNRYPGSYITDLNTSTLPEQFFSCLFWYLGLLALIWIIRHGSTAEAETKSVTQRVFSWCNPNGLYTLFWIIAPLASVVGTLEVRFFFTCYLLLFSGLALLPAQARFRHWLKRHALACLIGFSGIFILLTFYWRWITSFAF